MKLVRENIDFKRGANPKKSLRIGEYSREMIEKEKASFLVNMASVGMLAHWSDFESKGISLLRLENKLSDKSDRARFNIDTVAIICLLEPSNYIDKKYDADEVIEGPFVFISNQYESNQTIIEAKDADEALKVLLKLEYEESESWDYLTIMKKIISVLEDEGEESI